MTDTTTLNIKPNEASGEKFTDPIAESFKFKRNWTMWEHYE